MEEGSLKRGGYVYYVIYKSLFLKDIFILFCQYESDMAEL